MILLLTLPNPNNTETNNNAKEEEEEPVFKALDFDAMVKKIKDRISMLVKVKVPLTPTNLARI